MKNLLLLIFFASTILFAQETKVPEISVTPESFDFGKTLI